MKAPIEPSTISPAKRKPAVWAGVLAAGACMLAAGCSASGQSGASGSGAVPHAAIAGAAGRAAAHGPAPSGSSAGRPGGGLSLTALAPPGQSIIYTAGLTVRSGNVEAAVSRAAGVVAAAGGYVSAEQAALNRNQTTRPMVSIQFKIPVGTYRAALAALSGLGTKLSESQRAVDVTQTVADVTSRVASAHAMIAQLRKLLARTGSVGGLLSVQDQISQEEASLEALESQQRALAGETTYATVSMIIEGPVPPHHRHHHARKTAAGFLGGLTAGWHALRRVVGVLLTIAGAVLPFAIILALLALAAYVARRRLAARRKTGASPAQ
jgi:hypothetical protein